MTVVKLANVPGAAWAKMINNNGGVIMTDNMKKFLEAVSSDEALQKEFKVLADSATKEVDAHKSAIVELAAKHGFTLTEDDFKPSEMGELSEDEMKAVAGGSECGCAIYGGGGGDLTCACVWGVGGGSSNAGHKGMCACVGGGYGDNVY